jgi:hypothetical protein
MGLPQLGHAAKYQYRGASKIYDFNQIEFGVTDNNYEYGKVFLNVVTILMYSIFIRQLTSVFAEAKWTVFMIKYNNTLVDQKHETK